MRKIKCIVSDFDGVLAALQEAHFLSLNQALSSIDPKFAISPEEQLTRFEGLATRRKIEILIAEKGFPADYAEVVFDLKQELTAQAIEDVLSYDEGLVSCFSRLKEEGYQLYVASNAIRKTIVAGLKKLGILQYFERIYSNEDVSLTKPHPQIYLKAMMEAGSEPAETLIIEDSRTGREAAQRSGAHICEVNSVSGTTYEHIKASIAKAEGTNKPLKWYAKNTCNILILASGAGSRMRAKYQLPKPLIDVGGKPMIQRVVENLNIDAQYTFVVQAEHCANYNLEAYLGLIAPRCNVVKTDGITSGAAASALLAKDLIDNEEQLLIVNSDQWVSWDSQAFMYSLISSGADGQILTFHKENDPKWSYVSLDEKGFVTELAEKRQISNTATVGIYAFKHGRDFVSAAEQMIAKNITTNGEHYCAPCYNEMIGEGKKIRTFDCKEMYGLGTIEDLEHFLSL